MLNTYIVLIVACLLGQATVMGEMAYGCELSISVEGDATYCMDDVDVSKHCNGHGEQPSGTSCPLAGAEAVENCDADVPSWTGTSCVLSEDSTCKKLQSGAWGCVASSGDDDDDDTEYLSEASSSEIEETPSSCSLSISVEGDATYCMDDVDISKHCSGHEDQPSGTSCPLAGSEAVGECDADLPSWTGASCVLSKDSTCKKLQSGPWGCVASSVDDGDEAYVTEIPSTDCRVVPKKNGNSSPVEVMDDDVDGMAEESSFDDNLEIAAVPMDEEGNTASMESTDEESDEPMEETSPKETKSETWKNYESEMNDLYDISATTPIEMTSTLYAIFTLWVLAM